ncbi:hypothetical protein PanWU01x14_119460, partial [Parasponia andersonii]
CTVDRLALAPEFSPSSLPKTRPTHSLTHSLTHPPTKKQAKEFKIQELLTVNEREEATIRLVVINEQPLFLGLKISSERNQIWVPQSTDGFHVLLEGLPSCSTQLGGVEPLHAHD